MSGVPHGFVHPDGVHAVSDLKLRVASERIMGKRGLRFVGGEYNVGDKIVCVRSGKDVQMGTDDNMCSVRERTLVSTTRDRRLWVLFPFLHLGENYLTLGEVSFTI